MTSRVSPEGGPVTDIAMKQAPIGAETAQRARALAGFKLGDRTFYWLTRSATMGVLLLLGGIIVTLFSAGRRSLSRSRSLVRWGRFTALC